jgi:hypothetical protein
MLKHDLSIRAFVAETTDTALAMLQGCVDREVFGAIYEEGSRQSIKALARGEDLMPFSDAEWRASARKLVELGAARGWLTPDEVDAALDHIARSRTSACGVKPLGLTPEEADAMIARCEAEVQRRDALKVDVDAVTPAAVKAQRRAEREAAELPDPLTTQGIPSWLLRAPEDPDGNAGRTDHFTDDDDNRDGLQKLIDEVRAELERARGLHPPFESVERGLVVAGEEYGEVCKAVLQRRPKHARQELVQWLAMGFRLPIDCPSSFFDDE